MSLTTNIVAYWKLDESSGNAADATGNGWTLTNNGTTAYNAGLINNGADFGTSNTTKYLLNSSSISLSVAGSSDWSVSFWVNITTDLADGDQVGFWTASDNTNHILQQSFYFRSGSTRNVRSSYLAYGTSGTNMDYAFNLGTGVWHHIVYTHANNGSGGAMVMYVDGASQATGSGTGTGSLAPTGGFVVGGVLPSLGSLLNGHMDEVGAWNRVLTSDEVTTLYNAGAGLQYPFVVPNTSNFLAFM